MDGAPSQHHKCDRAEDKDGHPKQGGSIMVRAVAFELRIRIAEHKERQRKVKESPEVMSRAFLHEVLTQAIGK